MITRESNVREVVAEHPTTRRVLRVTLQLATDFTPAAYPLVGFTGFIEVVGLAWWGVELWRTMNLARTHRPQQLVMPTPLGAR